jgi:peptidoglycan/LPS O-acetylase OafA/YrhL
MDPRVDVSSATAVSNGATRSEIQEPDAHCPSTLPVGGITSDLPNLDLLRSVAVGLVFIGHMMNSMNIRGLGDLAHFGVLIFFVHTALVLMLSMERLGLSGGKLYESFAVRRIFRIYPLSILGVLFVVAFHVPSVPWAEGTAIARFAWPGWQGLLSNILLTQNITQSASVICVLWSLPFEVQMYGFLPFLYMLVRRFPALRTTSLIWVGGVILATLEYAVRSSTDPEFLLFRYAPCFLAGVIAWRLMTIRRHQFHGALWVLVLMALVVLYRLEDIFRVYGPDWQNALHGVLRNDHRIWLSPFFDLIRDWTFCGITGFAIPFFLEIKQRWLNAITKTVARYSYGIYICHVPVLWLCFNRLHIAHSAISAMLTVALTALVSFALYQFIESPAIQFGKRLSTRMVYGIARI